MDGSAPNLLYQFSEAFHIYLKILKAEGRIFVAFKLSLKKEWGMV
jgi:hypothetical protein